MHYPFVLNVARFLFAVCRKYVILQQTMPAAQYSKRAATK